MSGVFALADGTVVGRGDVYGGWVYHPSTPCAIGGGSLIAPCWQNTVTKTSLGGFFNGIVAGSGNLGAGAFAACPNNTQVIYASFAGNLFVSTNQGGTWIPVGQGWQLKTGIPANAGPNLLEYIACDPNNPDVAIVSAINARVYKITKGRSGLNAEVVSLPPPVPPTASKGAAIAYQLGSSSHLIVCIYDKGCFESENGGKDFVSIGGDGPIKVSQIISDRYDQFWGVVSGEALFKYKVGEGWRRVRGPVAPTSVAVDPTSSSKTIQRIATVSNFSGQLIVSDDDGLTWGPLWNGGLQTWTVPSGQPSWISRANQTNSNNLNVNEVAIDTSGKLWISGGIAFYNSNQQSGDPPWVSLNTSAATTSGNQLCFSSLPSSVRVGMRVQDPVTFNIPNNTRVASVTASKCSGATGVTLSASVSGTVASRNRVLFSADPYYSVNSADTTTMVVAQVNVAPGNSPITCQWDRGVSMIKNPDVFAGHQYPDSTVSGADIVGCWGIDWAAGTSNFVTAAMIGHVSAPASSSDGGNTWTAWPSTPTGFNFGATIAAWDLNRWAVVPAQNIASIYATINGGTGWTAFTFAGGKPANFVGNYALTGQHPITADRVNPSTYYAVDTSHQVWKCTTNCVLQGTVDTKSAQTNTQLKAVPGKAGHLLYSGGAVSTTTGGLFRSTNGGALWTNLNPRLKDVQAFGLGAPKPGGADYPAIYAIGILGGTYGIYASFDAGSTWAALNVPSTNNAQTHALDYAYQPSGAEGDLNVYGRLYVSFITGAGAGYIDTQDACPWVNFSNINPGTTVSGTVTLQAQHSGLVPVTSVSFYVDGSLIGTQTAGSGKPATYSQSWDTGGLASGSHTLEVTATGNDCNPTASTSYANFSIPVRK